MKKVYGKMKELLPDRPEKVPFLSVFLYELQLEMPAECVILGLCCLETTLKGKVIA